MNPIAQDSDGLGQALHLAVEFRQAFLCQERDPWCNRLLLCQCFLAKNILIGHFTTRRDVVQVALPRYQGLVITRNAT